MTAGIVSLVTVVAFEALAVATAMPVVADELGAVRSYALAFSLFLTTSLLGTVLAGGWSDRQGPRAPLLAGLALFCGGLVVSALAPTFPVLLLGRLVSGAGGGFLVVALYVVVAQAYPEVSRPRVFGWISAAWVLPSVVGPPVAGWLATGWTWRAVFWLGPVMALPAVVVLWPRLRLLGAGAGAAADARVRGRAVLGTGLAAGALALQWGAQHPAPTSGRALAAVAGGALLVAVTLPRLLPPGTLRVARGLPSVVVARGLLTASFFAAETFVPLMLVRERGLSPAVAGLSLTGGAVGWFLGAWLQGRPGLPVGRPVLLSAGGGLVAAAVGLLALTVLPGVPPGLVLPLWTLAGVGMGAAMSSTSVLVLGLSAPGEEGRNSAALQLSDALGSVLGIGAAGAVFAALHTAEGADGPVFATIWGGLALIGSLTVVVGVRARRSPPRARPGRAAAPPEDHRPRVGSA